MQPIHEMADVALRTWKDLLVGLPTQTEAQRRMRRNLAIVLESQNTHLRRDRGALYEAATTTANTGNFVKMILPLLRAVFPSLITNEIVSVQPMTGPNGSVFYMDYVRAVSKGATLAGTKIPQTSDRHYASDYVNDEIIGIGNGVDFGGAGAALAIVLAWNPVRPLNAALGHRVVIREIVVATGAVVQEAVDNGTGGFTGAVASGTINYENGSISNFKFTVAPAGTSVIKASYRYVNELNAKIPTVTIDIKQAPIQAESLKLKSLWSAEAAEDLRNQHGEEAEASLIGALASEMALEVDRLVVDDLFQASSGTTGAWDRAVPAGLSELQHLESLLTVMSVVSSTIHRKTKRAKANFAITGTTIGALLDQFTMHSDYKPVNAAGSADGVTYPADMNRALTAHGQFGVYRSGTLRNKWTIYEMPDFQEDFILMGLSSQDYLHNGYVWCPYVPLQITEAFQDPNDQSIRKSMRTRFGRKLTRAEYYGNVRVLNL